MEKFTLNIPAGVIEIDHENACGHEGIFSLSKERIYQIVELAYPINIKAESWSEFLEEVLDSVKPEKANEVLFIFFLFGRFYSDEMHDHDRLLHPESTPAQNKAPNPEKTHRQGID